MSRRFLIGTFANEHDLLGATRAARHHGCSVVDAYTPYPVHGMDEAMGLTPSRLGVVCFLFGLVGVVAALTFQHWTMAIDWPINVGGRPLNSWPAFLPVAFEVLVLFAGFGVVFTFLGISRLFPGKPANIIDPRVMDDQFVLVLEATGGAADAEQILAVLGNHHAVSAEERDWDEPRGSSWPSVRSLNIALIVLFILGVLMNWTMGADPQQPNVQFMPEMVQAVPSESFDRHADLPNDMVLQPPPEGAIARGHLPLHYEATPKDAERAGAELVNPLKDDDDRWRKRGAYVFTNYCAHCHDSSGAGDGPVAKRGVPPPPSLLAEKAVKMKDGQLFHIITYGQANMAPHAALVAREDRWAVILHIRQLQKAKGGDK